MRTRGEKSVGHKRLFNNFLIKSRHSLHCRKQNIEIYQASSLLFRMGCSCIHQKPTRTQSICHNNGERECKCNLGYSFAIIFSLFPHVLIADSICYVRMYGSNMASGRMKMSVAFGHSSILVKIIITDCQLQLP